MRPMKRVPSHPGEVLLEEFLQPLGVTQAQLAQHLGVPIRRISAIVRRSRGVSAETAWLLAQALGTTPEFWMKLQISHDLAAMRPSRPIAPLFPMS
jgi:antitoxin HigA-1